MINKHLFLLFLLVVQSTWAQNSLDLSFADNGINRIHLGYTDQAVQIATQTNDKIVVLSNIANIDADGNFDSNVSLLRLSENGIIDTTFGVDMGKTIFDFGNFLLSEAKDMLITPNNEIWVLGLARRPDSLDYQPYCVAKFNANGTPDTTFGTNGYVIFNFLGGTEMPAVLRQQPNGKVLVAGYTLTTVGVHQDNPALARLNPNGTFDTTFGTTGKVVFSFTDGLLNPNRIAVDTILQGRHGYGGFFSDVVCLPNGKILCGGGYNNGLNYQCLIMQFLPNGLLDTTYAIGGLRGISVDEGNNHYINKLLALPNGNVLAGLFIDSQAMPRDFYLMTLDSLGNAPFLNDSYDFEHQFDFIETMLLQPNGKLLCLGRSIKPINYQTAYSSDFFALCRLNNNLTALDTTFAQHGKWLFTTDSMRQHTAKSMVMQSDGKIVVLGNMLTPISSNRSDLLVVRLNNPIVSQTPNTSSPVGFSLYPNPITHHFIIENPALEKATLYLYDTQGNLVLQQSLPLSTNSIGAQYMPNGIFIALIVSNTTCWTTKVSKID